MEVRAVRRKRSWLANLFRRTALTSIQSRYDDEPFSLESPKMLAHYSHVRLEAKRTALANLSSTPTNGSYVTNHVTNEPVEKNPQPQLIGNMVDVPGIEPVP